MGLSVFLEPTADTKAQWIETPVGPGWSAVDDGAHYMLADTPPTPDTADYIGSTTNNDQSVMSFPDYDITGYTCSGWRLFMYDNTLTNQQIQLQGSYGGAELAHVTSTPHADAWDYVEYTGATSQAQINAFLATFTLLESGAQAGSSVVYALYLELLLDPTTTIPVASASADAMPSLAVVPPNAVGLDSVTTTDAAPTVAPHKISAITAEDTATVAFTPTHNGMIYPGAYLLPDPLLIVGGPSAFSAWRVRLGGADRNSGTLLGKKGRICGELCGSEPCASYSTASGVQKTEPITYAETGGPADGDYAVNIYAKPIGEDWA